MTRETIMRMLDANPDSFFSRLFMSALTGSCACPDLQGKSPLESALDVCVSFMVEDERVRAAALKEKSDEA